MRTLERDASCAHQIAVGGEGHVGCCGGIEVGVWRFRLRWKAETFCDSPGGCTQGCVRERTATHTGLTTSPPTHDIYSITFWFSQQSQFVEVKFFRTECLSTAHD